MRAVFDVVFGAEADARWDEAAALLDPKSRDLRGWLAREFFEFHLKRYSKSRRKAPIYWPLSTASGSYTLWLYYPSLTSQTLYTAINDFVEPKLARSKPKPPRCAPRAAPAAATRKSASKP